MSLPMLFAGGAECGPSNPLQNLSKRFENDRGVQQDHFGASRAGSSRDAFRTQTGPVDSDADATRFFSLPSTGAVPQFSTAFDVSAMRGALPLVSAQQPSQLHSPAPLTTAAATAGWAADFMTMNVDQGAVQKQVQGSNGSVGPVQMQQNPGDLIHSPSPLMQNWSPMRFGMQGYMPQTPMQPQQQQQGSSSRFGDEISWDKEFTAQEMQFTNPTTSEVQETTHKPDFNGDELARTAAMVIENLKHETNPKFQNSQFMGFMKQLRDGEVIVDGDKVVENDGRMRNSSQIEVGKDVKGKGKERLQFPLDPSLSSYYQQSYRQQQQQEQQPQNVETSGESELDAFLRQENADYTRYWEEFNKRMSPVSMSESVRAREWEILQEDWDRFEATTAGIKPLNNYQFQENNPYLLGNSSKTRHHAMHNEISPGLESVLELEAAVQREMTNARAWFDLGVKQQENEREHKALQALQRAVELDPTHLPSWLALAISYTNDNNRQGTYDAVEEWVKRNDRYATDQSTTASASLTSHERYTQLVDRLIAMARDGTNGEIDADIQIALAVLLNTNEDYEKAQDCFKTALAIRPDDWLLYNRVGATMANSGRAEDAIQYYYKALELNPGYIRAHFNLGISCINLRRYDEAAQYILDALILQDSDGVRDSHEGRGVTSMALWDSLKMACLHMQRSELATLCDSRNLEGSSMIRLSVPIIDGTSLLQDFEQSFKVRSEPNAKMTWDWAWI
ncbi:hypothetical protein AGABI2DRAFT_117731 [Agaricus bisporus var. bisporus H97]|uniref:hypothetical protein n=1 Tax=Agaricus bisporus var. bisporus (strain H97 / ATCC MYA-4626 / FGSC 10389) TaxID=936046 RepID=UPI00029F6512|nr:hypothetical protein AGABI2DRAFT_117731 [Agaricus bisporus var. bisporus H97]EKV47155.1 hypothetical protein AGABI2DRAFT_117731 [Agaricus bisporus var. bisporus H97]